MASWCGPVARRAAWRRWSRAGSTTCRRSAGARRRWREPPPQASREAVSAWRDAFWSPRDAFSRSRDAPRDGPRDAPCAPWAAKGGLGLIPLVLSVALATGVYLTFDGLARPRQQLLGGPRLDAVREFLTRAGLREVTPRQFVLFSLGAGLFAGLVSQLFLGWPIVTALCAGAGALAPYVYYVRRHDLRRRAVEEALIEAIEQLRDGIRGGLSVQESLAALARTGPEALRPEFSTLTREARLLGFDGALTAMRDRLADPVFDVVAAALLVNDRLGGRQVSQVLDRLAEATRAQLRIQQEVRAQQGRTVLSARIVAAAPLVALIGLRATNPRYLSIFDSLPGQLVLMGCAVSIGLGYLAMLYLTRLPGQRRVLVR